MYTGQQNFDTSLGLSPPAGLSLPSPPDSSSVYLALALRNMAAAGRNFSVIHEKILHCRYVCMCPTMDLVASLHADGQLSVHRCALRNPIDNTAYSVLVCNKLVFYVSRTGCGLHPTQQRQWRSTVMLLFFMLSAFLSAKGKCGVTGCGQRKAVLRPVLFLYFYL